LCVVIQTSWLPNPINILSECVIMTSSVIPDMSDAEVSTVC